MTENSRYTTQVSHERSSFVEAVGDDARETHLEMFLHDVRTPLAVVLTALETVARYEDDLDAGTRQHLIERAIQHTRQVRQLMHGYQELGRLQAGAIPLERARIRVDELLTEVVETHEAGVNTELHLAPAEAAVDPVLTRRAFGLLIDNVVMHTPLGSTMTVQTEQADGGVLVTVDDNGSGVPLELRKRIFEPFERGSAPSQRSGIGLGLSVIRGIARLHGGDAWAEESPAGGTRIRLMLR